jgi:hypothetical protein
MTSIASVLRALPMLALVTAGLPAQALKSARSATALLHAPGGRLLATIAPGTELRVVETRGEYSRVQLRGFIDTAFVRGRRDTFPNSVGGRGGTVRMRAEASRNARLVADLNVGMGLSSMKRSGGFAAVERSGPGCQGCHQGTGRRIAPGSGRTGCFRESVVTRLLLADACEGSGPAWSAWGARSGEREKWSGDDAPRP